MDTAAIERKWSEAWREGRLFEADPRPGAPKKYVTAAFPYPNSPQHIGHARTYTTADIYARYLRLKGNHVLFPMAFHVTGTPILAMAKRIAAKDKEVLSVFESIYGIPPKKAESLTDPKALVAYFSDEIEQGMKEMGFSIDWRRKFYSYDERFNRFIEWQFRKLKELGYLIKGEYPIAWCPEDGNAVSAHDTRGDVDPELEHVSVITFPLSGREDGACLIVTTYRPETVYGVTNIWLNPQVRYVEALLEGRKAVLSQAAAQALSLQLDLEVQGPADVRLILASKAKNLVTGQEVPIYGADFVKADVGTGIVMSVPAHAPLDYLALRDLGKADIPLPQVVELKGYGPAPAKEEVERMGLKSQNDPLAQKATKEIYTKEAHGGVMHTGRHKGQPISKAKDLIKEDLKNEGIAFDIVTLANGPIHCRCGGKVLVNILKDQWFIDYGIGPWKAKAKECLEGMSIIPEKTRSEYLYTIDWFKTRPCTRAAGLGTRFPFDQGKMIEALSDSTLYMAYYTIAHQLAGFKPSDMDDGFFDYVFLGKGEGRPELKPLRESFLYWYPVDSRHSAGDLIRNHLTLYILNHVGILPKEHWPRQIATNGFVLMDGAKMSKSMGNILPLRKAIAEYGADVIRFSVVSGADLSTDTDFNKSVAEGVRSRLAVIERLVGSSAKAKGRPNGRIERWLLSRLNRKIAQADKLYADLALRDLALELFYSVAADLQWYMKRSKDPNLRDFFNKWLVLMAPIIPHHAEEWWSALGNEGPVSLAPFPEADEGMVDDRVERAEELVTQVHEDIEKISGLIGKKPQKAVLIVAGAWKRELYSIARQRKELAAIMKEASVRGLPMKEAQGLMKGLMRNIHSLPEPLRAEDELEALEDAQAFLSSEFGCEVEVVSEEASSHPKARNALPGKCAIVLD